MSEVNGKPHFTVPELIAHIRKQSDCEYFAKVATDYRGSTWQTKRRGQSAKAVTYTMEDARVAGLAVPGSMWEKQPAAMCSATAAKKLAAEVWSEVVL